MDMNVALKEARDLIEKQDAELKRISEMPMQIARVDFISDNWVYVSGGGLPIRLMKPAFKLNEGDLVLLNAESGQIVERNEDALPVTGMISQVQNIMDENYCEIDAFGGAATRVRIGKVKVQKGDRVILDASRSFIIQNLGRKNDAYRPESIPNVEWDDIGGLEEAKQLMREAVEWPHKYGDIYKSYGKKPSKGLLLFGPPGCGKTLLGKAAAHELAKIYGKNGVDSGFHYIKGPEILNKYVGESEGSVRNLFTQSKLHKQENGYPAVIFIDEADAILGKRGVHGHILSSTIVPMFLTEMDGLEESSALVILATNRQDILDPAVVRDGRIDRKIRITRPDRKNGQKIIEINLRDVPVIGIDKQELASRTADEVYSEKRRLYRIEHDGERDYLTMRDTVNGAMLAGVVDFALSLAIRRDIDSKTKPKDRGIRLEDMLEAVNRSDMQSRDLNHDDNLDEFIESLGLIKDDVQITKAKPKKTSVVEIINHEEEEDSAEAA